MRLFVTGCLFHNYGRGSRDLFDNFASGTDFILWWCLLPLWGQQLFNIYINIVKYIFVYVYIIFRNNNCMWYICIYTHTHNNIYDLPEVLLSLVTTYFPFSLVWNKANIKGKTKPEVNPTFNFTAFVDLLLMLLKFLL